MLRIPATGQMPVLPDALAYSDQQARTAVATS